MKTFSPVSSEFQVIEYSGPSNSAESLRPAPTKLHEVVTSPIAIVPLSVSNSMVAEAKSSEGGWHNSQPSPWISRAAAHTPAETT